MRAGGAASRSHAKASISTMRLQPALLAPALLRAAAAATAGASPAAAVSRARRAAAASLAARAVASSALTSAQQSIASTSAPDERPWAGTQAAALALVAAESLRRALGAPLLEGLTPEGAEESLWAAPFALILCNRQPAVDLAADGPAPPAGELSTGRGSHLYANRAALQALGARWGGGVVEPGRVYELPPNPRRWAPPPPLEDTYQQQRAAAGGIAGASAAAPPPRYRLLRDASWTGAGGRSLALPALLVAPLFAASDALLGAAFIFDAWSLPDGSIGRPGAPEARPEAQPTAEALAAAADGVRAQADAVRALKVQQGLGNRDPAVLQAVAELQRRREGLEALQAAADAFAAPSAVEALLARCAAARAAAAAASAAAAAAPPK